MTSQIGQHAVAAYTRQVIRFRWLVLAACLLAAGLAALGLRNFQFSADYKAYFGPDNPKLITLQEFEGTYTKSENILFVLQPRDKNVFSRRTLEIVRQLTEDAWQIPNSIRVDSITNFQHTTADGDELTVADLVDRPSELTTDRLAEIKTVALNEPALAGRLRLNAQPVFFASLTTAIGFLSLNFSDSPPFHELGNVTANLTGPYTLEFSMDSGEAGGIAKPDYLRRLENFVAWLRTSLK